MDPHKEFVKLSFDIIKMKNRLISLLLEIYEKEIYKHHNCRTIHEYGFKYAKLSKEMVDKTIRTLKHLENKPFLKQAIESQGIHKVAMVATLATPENERIFAKHVENLSKPALFEFSKELRWKQRNEKALNQEAMFSGQARDAQQNSAEMSQPGASIAPQFCQAVPSKMTIELDEEMQILFLKFKEKYAKNLSNREALRVMLKKMDGKDRKTVANTKSKTAVVTADYGILKNGGGMVAEVVYKESEQISIPGNGTMKHQKMENNSKPISKIIFPSRYIQKKRDREIRTKYQHKCAYPGCVKTVEVMHHRIPFAFERSHKSIIPLCDVHHEFAHNGLIAHELREPEKWTLKTTGIKSIYDGFYLDKKSSQKLETQN